MPVLDPLKDLDPRLLETTPILRLTAAAGRRLAELKGASADIPNQRLLLNSLVLQEAKDSSEIENIITTHDEVYRESLFPDWGDSAAAKEVRRYVQALRVGDTLVRESGLLTARHILTIQETLEDSSTGFRKLPGTTLKNSFGDTVYTPPQDHGAILNLMADLERFINDDTMSNVDPLIKMAVIHHQFESIHPFYDGNGRTGRIINVLYLVQQGLLDMPILYLSRYIVRTKGEYYRLLQDVRDSGVWEDWILYILRAVDETAVETLATVSAIKAALLDYKRRIRTDHKFYSQTLINNLFSHPYTKIEFVERDLNVSRLTATKYLDALAASGFLRKHRIGRSNFYTNLALFRILTGEDEAEN